MIWIIFIILSSISLLLLGLSAEITYSYYCKKAITSRKQFNIQYFFYYNAEKYTFTKQYRIASILDSLENHISMTRHFLSLETRSIALLCRDGKIILKEETTAVDKNTAVSKINAYCCFSKKHLPLCVRTLHESETHV